MDRTTLTDIFARSLKGITSIELVNTMYSKTEAVFDFMQLSNGKKAGAKISMLFNPHRYETRGGNERSIIQAFNDDKFLSGLARVALWKIGRYRNSELLYQCLQLGVNHTQYVNEFPPNKARDLYIEYNAKRILDPCAGWGGRMIGAASVGAFYHGFEPATKTYKGLLKLGEWLKLFKTGFDYKIDNMPFEDVEISNHYDIALTSPPYYDTEIYSDEETNSCNRYKTFEEWVDYFYIPMIRKVTHNNIPFLLNIGDRKYNLSEILYKNFENVKCIESKIGGKAGLGKEKKSGESFYLVHNN